MENQNPATEETTEQAHEAATSETDATEAAAKEPVVVVEELPDFEVSNIANQSPLFQLKKIKTTDGSQFKVCVAKLSGNRTLKLIRDANSAKDPNAGIVAKLTRCLVRNDDHKVAKFSQADAEKIINDGDAELLRELMAAIHSVNPLLKNS